jgi:hypothetical protein
MPVVETTPPVLARPKACVSRLYSPQVGARLSTGSALTWIDPQPLHRRKVNHLATFANRVSRDVVTAPTDGHKQVVVAGEVHSVHDIGDANAARDQRRPLIDHAVPDSAGIVIARVAPVLALRQAQMAAGVLATDFDVLAFGNPVNSRRCE